MGKKNAVQGSHQLFWAIIYRIFFSPTIKEAEPNMNRSSEWHEGEETCATAVVWATASAQRWRTMKEGRKEKEKMRKNGLGAGFYLVKELRAEWCWVSGVERWRGCGRDRAPGAGRTRRAPRRKCPIAGALSSAGRALPNLGLEKRRRGYSQWCGGK